MSRTNPESRLISPREFARRAGINEEVVRRQCREGRLPARKVGRLWRIAESVLSIAPIAEEAEIQEAA